MVLITDFKTKLKKKRYKNDKSGFERNIIKNVIWHFGLQIIKEPTHILNNSSCIDLIFPSQADLLMESGMDPSMHSNCHHQIIYLKFDLHIFFFDREKAFSNTSINDKVAIFNGTILNILNNHIPHETNVCNDRDPLWFNDKIRLLIKNKKRHHTNIFVKMVMMLIGNII